MSVKSSGINNGNRNNNFLYMCNLKVASSMPSPGKATLTNHLCLYVQNGS